jgi:rsbT co-antagonist protein RsbR
MGQVTVDDELTYQRMMDSITEYEVIRLDPRGLVDSWHAGAQRLTGYAADEIIGRPVSVFYADEDVASGVAEREMAAAADEGRFETEGWRIRKDATRFWASVSLTPIRDQVGGLLGYVKVARDLTERRESEQALLGMEKMLESITDYEVIRLDRHGLI